MTKDGQDPGKTKAESGARDAKKSAAPARPSKRRSEDDQPESPILAPTPADDEPRGRRRLPYAALLALLALVAVGLYVAWPAIQERIDAPSFQPETQTSETSRLPEVPSAIDQAPAPAAPPAAEQVDARVAAANQESARAVAALNERLASLEQAFEKTSARAALVDSAPLDELGARMEALESALAALPPPSQAGAATTARLDALEALSANSPDAMPALNAANLRLNRLESRIAALAEQAAQAAQPLAEWQSANAALAGALEAATGRMNALEAAFSQQSGAEARLVSLVFASGRLNAALGRPMPFTRALGALRSLAGNDAALGEALAQLRPLAASGVQTMEGLRSRFPEVASAIVRASAVPENATWVDETVAKLSQIVTVRRTDATLEPESRDGRLLRAEQALASGDLAASVDVLESFQGDAAGPWLAAAHARLTADAALEAIDLRVAALVEERWPVTAD